MSSAPQAAHKGTMVALFPPPDVAQRIAVAGGEQPDDLHLTLCYIADTDGGGVNDPVEPILSAVLRWAATTAPLTGTLGGVGRFNPSLTSDGMPVTYASADLPALPAAREQLMRMLAGQQVAPSVQHGFTPHMTLAYADRLGDADADGPVRFDTVSVVGPHGHHTVPLAGQTTSPKLAAIALAKMDPTVGGGHLDSFAAGDSLVRCPVCAGMMTAGSSRCEQCGTSLGADSPTVKMVGGVPIIKAAPLLRYTASPVYIPNREDAHGDWADTDGLQKAIWNFNRNGDKTLDLQHSGGHAIGEVVECMCIPFEHEATLIVPGEGVRKVLLPANTPWAGVRWSESAMNAVLRGLLRGLSLEGKAKRMVADLPSAA